MRDNIEWHLPRPHLNVYLHLNDRVLYWQQQLAPKANETSTMFNHVLCMWTYLHLRIFINRQNNQIHSTSAMSIAHISLDDLGNISILCILSMFCTLFVKGWQQRIMHSMHCLYDNTNLCRTCVWSQIRLHNCKLSIQHNKIPCLFSCFHDLKCNGRSRCGGGGLSDRLFLQYMSIE